VIWRENGLAPGVCAVSASGYGGINAFGAGQGFPSELGNKVALNVGKGAPGAGRTIYKSGSQQGLQSAKPLPAGHSALCEQR